MKGLQLFYWGGQFQMWYFHPLKYIICYFIDSACSLIKHPVSLHSLYLVIQVILTIFNITTFMLYSIIQHNMKPYSQSSPACCVYMCMLISLVLFTCVCLFDLFCLHVCAYLTCFVYMYVLIMILCLVIDLFFV